VTDDDVDGVVEELTDRYGQIPEPVQNLLAVARFRIHARRAGVTEVVAQGNFIRLTPVELPDSRAMRLTRLYPGSLVKPATRTILVPRPMTARWAASRSATPHCSTGSATSSTPSCSSRLPSDDREARP